jgi:cytochrome c peroxidase
MIKQLLLTSYAILAIVFLLHFINGCLPTTQKNIYADKILLGKYLFFDRRLSVNNTKSCGTCHNPQFAFTDGYKRSLGAFADLHQRNTATLFNLKYLKYLTAADSTFHSPLQQMDRPLFNNHPIEMGAKGIEEKILSIITSDSLYQDLFTRTLQKISWQNIKLSITAFVLNLQSFNSPYDKYLKGDSNALNTNQINGKNLFFSSTLKCVNCHGGINFSTPNIFDNLGDTTFYFNTGLYNIDGKGAYPTYDMGLFDLTKEEKDMGKFRVPTLRNLSFTAPFLHDGSANSLTEIIDNYATGGRNIAIGKYKGNGAKNPYKHSLINGFTISEKDKIDLIFFLNALSDSSVVNNPNYKNPFTEDETKKKY